MPRATAPSETIVAKRLRELIALRRTTAQRVSVDAGKSYGLVRDILSGKVKQPRPGSLDSIASVLDVDVAYILGQHNNRDVYIVPHHSTFQGKRPPASRYKLCPMPVVGLAEPDTFRANPVNWRASTMIDGLPSKLLPDAKHFALEMRGGDGFDGRATRYAFCVDIADDKLPVSNGEVYAIQADRNGAAEVCLRRARLFSDRIELTEITGAASAGNRVLRVGRDLDSDPSKPVFVLGLVYAVLMEMSQYGL